MGNVVRLKAIRHNNVTDGSSTLPPLFRVFLEVFYPITKLRLQVQSRNDREEIEMPVYSIEKQSSNTVDRNVRAVLTLSVS
jgi:hypothetical protein